MNQVPFSNAVAGGVRFVFTTTAEESMQIRVSITGFDFISDGAFTSYSAPEPGSLVVIVCLLAVALRTRAA